MTVPRIHPSFPTEVTSAGDRLSVPESLLQKRFRPRRQQQNVKIFANRKKAGGCKVKGRSALGRRSSRTLLPKFQKQWVHDEKFCQATVGQRRLLSLVASVVRPCQPNYKRPLPPPSILKIKRLYVCSPAPYIGLSLLFQASLLTSSPTVQRITLE